MSGRAFGLRSMLKQSCENKHFCISHISYQYDKHEVPDAHF